MILNLIDKMIHEKNQLGLSTKSIQELQISELIDRDYEQYCQREICPTKRIVRGSGQRFDRGI